MASNSKLTAIVAALLPRPIYNQPHDQNAGATPRVKAAMGRSVGCVVRGCPAPGRLRGHSWPRRRRGPTQGHDDHAGHRLAQRQPEVGGRLRVRRRLRVERRRRSGAGPTICHGGRQPNQMLAFSHCMQTHGVPNFPEPNSQGVVQGSGINPSSPSFQSASKDCRHLLPNGGQPTPAQQAQALAQALKFSQCMRSHGISDFPDPQSAGGGRISISLRGGPGSDLNPQNPQFQSAQTACGGGPGGPGGPKGGLSTHGQSKSPSGAVAG